MPLKSTWYIIDKIHQGKREKDVRNKIDLKYYLFFLSKSIILFKRKVKEIEMRKVLIIFEST